MITIFDEDLDSLILSEFKYWTADKIMESKMHYPDRNSMKEFLAADFPKQRHQSHRLWAKYIFIELEGLFLAS